MNDMSKAPTTPAADYLASADATITLQGKTFDVSLDLHGRYSRPYPATRSTPAERGGFVLDCVMWGKRDVTTALPDEAYELLTTYLNEVL